MQQKVVTSEIFRGRKEGYSESLNQPFASSRLGECAFRVGWASASLRLPYRIGGDSFCSGSLPRGRQDKSQSASTAGQREDPGMAYTKTLIMSEDRLCFPCESLEVLLKHRVQLSSLGLPSATLGTN